MRQQLFLFLLIVTDVILIYAQTGTASTAALATLPTLPTLKLADTRMELSPKFNLLGHRSKRQDDLAVAIANQQRAAAEQITLEAAALQARKEILAQSRAALQSNETTPSR